MGQLVHRITAGALVFLAGACSARGEQPADHTAQALAAAELGVWVPRVPLTPREAARGREALEAAGVPVYLVLPGQVMVTAPVAEAPPSTTFEPLSAATTWTTRASTVQSHSTALALSLLRAPSRAGPEPGIVDDVGEVEDQLADARQALEAERAAATNPLVLRRVDRDLAALDAEAQALTAEPVIGTPAHSRRKYLRGSILVYCLFVESQGTGNEDWTTAEVELRIAAYAQSLLELARVAPVEYHLSFTLDHLAPPDARMQISHEPTDGVPERTWIVQVLRNLGYGGVITAAGGTQRLERDLIDEFGVREATVVYVARDAVPPQADGSDAERTAYPHAWYNSYAITNSQEGGATLVHEVLHTFNADDEYSDVGRPDYGCVARSSVGHARAVEAGSGGNSNANQRDCLPQQAHQSCVMNVSATAMVAPFRRPVLCWHTRAQIGWRDTAAVHVRLDGLPSSTPEAFVPALVTHVDGRAVSLAETFSYVEQGGLLFGGRRCVFHGQTATRFTSTGDLVSCPVFSLRTQSVAGAPSDIRVGGEGRVHALVVPYTPIAAVPCGDGVCDVTETSATCAADCQCGNDACDGDEDVASCPDDCAFCGDEVCTPGETRASCPADCFPDVPITEGR
jgi:hypothetical protein